MSKREQLPSPLSLIPLLNKTRSSAVVVIADRTARSSTIG